MPWPEDMEECVHGVVGPCSVCRAPQKKREEEWGEFATRGDGIVRATYYGKCAGCKGKIEPGDWIVRQGTGEGWWHEDC